MRRPATGQRGRTPSCRWRWSGAARWLAVAMIAACPAVTHAQRPLGLDVSGWETLSANDWVNIRNSGRVFGFARASYGWGGTDTQFTTHVTNARAAGIYMGAYHFSYPGYSAGNTPTNEANTFLDIARTRITTGYLRPILDVEYGPGPSMNGLTLSQWCRQWCDYVYQQTGVKPLIYTNANYGQGLDASLKSAYELWVAAWWTNPNVQTDNPATFGWSTWKVWQYAGDVTLPGVLQPAQKVDLNVFNGTMAQLQSTLLIGTPPTIAYSPSALSVAVQPGLSTNAPFTVRNSSSGMLNFTVSENVSWLSLNPSGGTSTGPNVTITATFNALALTVGTYTTNILIQDPAATNNPQTLPVTLTVRAAKCDFDADNHVDADDLSFFLGCLTGRDVAVTNPNCQKADVDGDTDVDQTDFAALQKCYTGTDIADPYCGP